MSLCSAQPTLLRLGPSCTTGCLDALWLPLQSDKWGTPDSVPKNEMFSLTNKNQVTHFKTYPFYCPLWSQIWGHSMAHSQWAAGKAVKRAESCQTRTFSCHATATPAAEAQNFVEFWSALARYCTTLRPISLLQRTSIFTKNSSYKKLMLMSTSILHQTRNGYLVPHNHQSLCLELTSLLSAGRCYFLYVGEGKGLRHSLSHACYHMCNLFMNVY